MKTYILTALLVLAPVFAHASFDRSLTYGMSGNDVLDLQEILVESDCLAVSPTGYFGLLTTKAVQCWQTKNSLPSTGYFGTMSRGIANAALTSALGASTEAEIAETGTTTPPQVITLCPVGFTCTPKNDIIPVMDKTLAPVESARDLQIKASKLGFMSVGTMNRFPGKTEQQVVDGMTEQEKINKKAYDAHMLQEAKTYRRGYGYIDNSFLSYAEYPAGFFIDGPGSKFADEPTSTPVTSNNLYGI